MGIENTRKGKIYYPYLSSIFPTCYQYFIKRNEIVKTNGKIIYLNGLKI